jgi:hypothetical protein
MTTTIGLLPSPDYMEACVRPLHMRFHFRFLNTRDDDSRWARRRAIKSFAGSLTAAWVCSVADVGGR